MSLRTSILIVATLAGTNCSTPEEDPLSDEAIEDVIRDEGNAVGDDWSGRYKLTLDQSMCDCPTIAGLDLCTQLTDENTVDVEVVQTGGFLQVMLAGYQLAGPVQQSGAFQTAGLFDLTTIATSGDLAVRLDGQFMEQGDQASLAGTLQFRVDAAVAEEALVCERSDRANGPRQADEPTP